MVGVEVTVWLDQLTDWQGRVINATAPGGDFAVVALGQVVTLTARDPDVLVGLAAVLTETAAALTARQALVVVA